VTAIVVAGAAVAVAFLLALLGGRTPSGSGSSFDDAIATPRATVVPEPRASLVAARRVIVNATAPRSRYLRTRPVLVELTESRLRDRHGIGLDSPHAATIVGEPLWSIVRPGAKAPDHDDAGLSPADIAAVLDRLESL
jgi:hypothetical protein